MSAAPPVPADFAGVSFVPLSPERLEAVTDLEGRIFAGRDPWTRRAFEHELGNPDSLWLVGEAAGEVVAYGGGWVVQGEFQLLNLAVAPGCRRRGIGRHLLESLLAAARGRGCAYAVLDVRSGNAAAIALYERLGFGIERLRKRYYSDGEDAVVMVGALPGPVSPAREADSGS